VAENVWLSASAGDPSDRDVAVLATFVQAIAPHIKTVRFSTLLGSADIEWLCMSPLDLLA